MVKKVLFLGQIFEMETFMDLHIMKIPKSENHIFSDWSVRMCVCVCACVCVCVSVISQIQKQIIAKTSNLVFYICIMYRYLLKLFMMIGQKLCVQGYKKEYK